MSLTIKYYHFYSNCVSILVEVYIRIYLQNSARSAVLTNVKTCFLLPVGILIIHSPCLKHEKQFLHIYINTFLSKLPLIKTPTY